MTHRITALASTLALTVGALVSVLAAPQSAAAATADPCNSGGFVRVAQGDMGSAPNIRAGYAVGYDTRNNNPFYLPGAQGADHTMQWEMGWSASAQNAKFCALNLGAIGRNSLVVAAGLYAGSARQCGVDLQPASVSGGAGWTAVTSTDACPGVPIMGRGWRWTVEFGESWANRTIHAWSNVSLTRG